MLSAMNNHTYFFMPGRWEGTGTLSIVGGASEEIILKMVVSQSGTGTITAHMEIDFSSEERAGGVELVYTINPPKGAGFSFVQYNSQLGELSGDGKIIDDKIFLEYQNSDGSYGGVETLERKSESFYLFRGTMSMNGVPGSRMEAEITRLKGEQL